MAPNQKTRVAIYARVSTIDKGQDPENQLQELRQYCRDMGYTVAKEYVDHESGRKGAEKRAQFRSMLDEASRRPFDLVLFWALDRFSREGMLKTVVYLQRLDNYGIGFRSFTEPHLSTENEMARDVVLAILSSFAKAEAQKISERTKAGLKRARAAGKRVGRPPLDQKKQERIRRLRESGKTVIEIARQERVSRRTVYNICLD